MAQYHAHIPVKLPGLNDYVRACRANRFEGAKMKQDAEQLISFYLRGLPDITCPVTIRFHWTEGNRRRDLDNVAFAKKFVLDALVKTGKLPNDNRKFVRGFRDTFEEYKGTWCCDVIITEEEPDEGTTD